MGQACSSSLLAQIGVVPPAAAQRLVQRGRVGEAAGLGLHEGDPCLLVRLFGVQQLQAAGIAVPELALRQLQRQLAEALLNGATLADFAQEREVSKQTLRNQLVGVMRKTGTKRQSELVSLLTRLSLTCL